MPTVLRVILARLIGSLVASFATWLASRGIDLDADSISAVVTILLTIFSVVYGLVHTAINARINPNDVSSPTIAAIQKEESKNDGT